MYVSTTWFRILRTAEHSFLTAIGIWQDLRNIFRDRLRDISQSNNIKFYTIDGIKLGIETGMGARINTILQAAFFKLANIIPIDDAVKYMKDAATASYMQER